MCVLHLISDAVKWKWILMDNKMPSRQIFYVNICSSAIRINEYLSHSLFFCSGGGDGGNCHWFCLIRFSSFFFSECVAPLLEISPSFAYFCHPLLLSTIYPTTTAMEQFPSLRFWLDETQRKRERENILILDEMAINKVWWRFYWFFRAT